MNNTTNVQICGCQREKEAADATICSVLWRVQDPAVDVGKDVVACVAVAWAAGVGVVLKGHSGGVHDRDGGSHENGQKDEHEGTNDLAL